MSRRLVNGFLIGFLLLLCAVSLNAALANADALTQLASPLVPSRSAEMLGPITEKGRTGWACQPERAASASRADEADLPKADATE